MAIAIALLAVSALTCAYLSGLWVGMRRSYAEKLRGLGFNKTSADLYVRAADLLREVDQFDEYGRLPPETKALIANWAIDYRNGGSL